MVSTKFKGYFQLKAVGFTTTTDEHELITNKQNVHTIDFKRREFFVLTIQ